MIRRHFLRLPDGRQVHYRRAGSGPAVLLLHQSPASSAELIPLIDELAADWTVFAPDTAGNGLSDPLPMAAPGMLDYAKALISFMDSLHIERAAIYGFHSGAACALAVAHAYPRRISVVVANGYTRLAPEMLADILDNYLVPLPLDWSGSHLAWAWARIREQFLFFPWHRADAEHQLRTGMPRTEVLQTAVMDLLRAGENYLAPYRAAFSYDRDRALREMTVPTLVMTARTDALYSFLDHMPPPAATVRVARPANYAAARALLREMLLACAQRETAPDVDTATDNLSHSILSWDSVQLPSGSLLARRAAATQSVASAADESRAVLFVHDSAGSALAMQHYMRPVLGTHVLLAIDLPGNGESDAHGALHTDLASQAELLAVTARSLGYGSVSIMAEGDGAVLAVELATQHPQFVRSLALANLDEFKLLQAAPDHGPALTTAPLQSHGEHLLTAWHHARDEALFVPWYQTAAPNRRGVAAAELDPRLLQQRTLDLLKSRSSAPAVLRQRLTYPLTERLRQLKQPVYAANAARCADGAARFMAAAQYQLGTRPSSEAS
jgi:pimeloyl-ACP methyl ester carboxylesterase